MPLRCWLAVLWVAALVVLFTHLGDLPLRDWDEALVARVAEEISQRPFPANLLPTLWGEPYLNKPPLLHALIAVPMQLWHGAAPAGSAQQLPPEWLVRGVPALVSSLIVPLVALVQWRLRPGDRLAAICTAAVALTLLPLMRHGRLAMLDGSLIVAMALQWWALLSLPLRPDPAQRRRWGLVAGLAGSAILLLKAPAALPLLIGACLLLAWERRRPPLAWIGMGLLPGLLWHGWHLGERGADAWRMWGGQGLARVVSAIEGHAGGLMVPVTEVLEGGWPWLALWPLALLIAWRQRQERWGFWVLGLTLLTAAAVLPLQTQLPWYSHLLWPSFALAVGPLFAQLIRRDAQLPVWLNRLLIGVPSFWVLAGATLLLVMGRLTIPAVVVLPAGLALVLGGSLLMAQRLRLRRLGSVLLVALLWVALLGLVSGRLWLWELSEDWSVQPVAAWLEGQPAPVLWEGGQRPSLDWYLGRELVTGKRARRMLRDGRSELLVLRDQAPVSPALICNQEQRTTDLPPRGPSLFRCVPR